ncbi:MAG: hypothetical protein RMJ33_05860 [Saprospiraceae bacterium]|nr:hypothetical protein [Saprospiraceae bacterium]MDW8229344.1 hypothetical protein [Saprospiraceae bacterium]
MAYRTFLYYLCFFVWLASLFACSAQRQLQRRLTGTWNVTRYEILYPSGQREETFNVGTIVFHRNGNGDNDMPILTRNIRTPNTRRFSWKNTDQSVTIISENTFLAKAWIIVENRRNRQVWRSTTNELIQTMELQKVQ